MSFSQLKTISLSFKIEARKVSMAPEVLKACHSDRLSLRLATWPLSSAGISCCRTLHPQSLPLAPELHMPDLLSLPRQSFFSSHCLVSSPVLSPVSVLQHLMLVRDTVLYFLTC